MTAVGPDGAAHRIRPFARAAGLHAHFIEKPKHATGTAVITVNAAGRATGVTYFDKANGLAECGDAVAPAAPAAKPVAAAAKPPATKPPPVPAVKAPPVAAKPKPASRTTPTKPKGKPTK